MRILYLTDQLYLHGGAEKILVQKLNYWAETGNETTVAITNQHGKPSCYTLHPNVKLVDLSIEYKDGVSMLNWTNYSKLPQHYKILKSLIEELNPEAISVVSQSVLRYITPLVAGSRKTFYEYHTSYYGFQLGYQKLGLLRKVKKRIANKLVEVIENRYTNVVFLNQWEFDHYKRSNAVIIPNFFDELSRTTEGAKEKQVISLGRLSFQKGYDLLIDAWEIVHRSAPEWTLKIFGNGTEEKKLKAQIQVKELTGSIQINKAINDVNHELSTASIYVMSSRYETFPMVLLEAMTHGLPIVAFDCPTGPRSILTVNDDSLLVQQRNINELAKGIIRLINDQVLRTRLGANAKVNVERFNQQSVMAQWKELFTRQTN